MFQSKPLESILVLTIGALLGALEISEVFEIVSSIYIDMTDNIAIF